MIFFMNAVRCCWRKLRTDSSIVRVWFAKHAPPNLVVVVLASSLSLGAGATEQVFSLQIESKTADQALIEFAEQTDRTLVYSYNDTHQIVTNRVVGQLSLLQGLQQMLRDTGLAFSIDRGGAIRVMRESSSKMDTTMNKKTLLSQALAIITGTMGVQALGAQPSDTEAVNVIEEVIVTATRRSTSAQDTPISLSAFNDATLAKQGIESFEGIARQTPGVILTGANSFSRFVVRGIQTSSTSSSNGEQRQVAVYYDDVPVSSFSVVTPNLRLFDVERVEVLRGPQGTSFGSGSLSGAVRVVTQKAKLGEFDAAVRLDYANIDQGGHRRRLSAMANMPLGDQFAARVVAYDRDEDGYIDNIGSFGAAPNKDENSSDEQGYRVSAVWQPSDAFKMTFAHSSDEQDMDGLAASQNPNLGEFKRATFFTEPLTVELDITSLTFDYDFGFAQATLTSSVSDQLTAWDLDLDALFGPALTLGYGETLDFDTTIHELRLVSSDAGPLSWLAGLYWFDLEASARGAQFADPNVLALYGVDASAIPRDRAPGVTLATVRRQVQNDEKALYGELSWALNDALTLTVGGRYTQYQYAQADIDNYGSNILTLAFTGGGVAGIVPLPNPSYSTGDKSASIFKASLQWDLNENAMAYFSVSEGFRRSHPNALINSTVNPNEPDYIPAIADADSLLNYELGYKTRALDGRMTLNASVYFIDWQDAQVSGSRQSDAAPFVTNAGDIEAYGFEMDMRYLASSALELGGTLSLSSSEVVSLNTNTALASGLTEGASLVGSDQQLSAFAEYQVWRSENASVYVRVDAEYSSDYVNGPRNVPGLGLPNPRYTKTDAILNVNAQVGYETDNVGVYVYGENLGSEDGRVWQNPDPFSNNNVVTLAPRTVGVRIDYRL